MIRILARYRWLTSIFLLILVDICTFSAFQQTTTTRMIPSQDKVLHFLAFFVLFLVGHLALRFDFFRKTNRHIFLLGFNWLIWLAYGALLEVGQSFLSYRQAEMSDFLSDVMGMVLGTVVVLLSKPIKPDSGAS